VYQCGLCRGWHLTKQPEGQRAPAGQRQGRLRRSATTRRQRQPLPQRSEKRSKAMAKERVPFVLDVLARRPWCEVRLSWCCTGRSSDVNELQRGPFRTDCWLDDDKVVSSCGACHRWLTDHPEWAYHHGHQLEHEPGDAEAFALAVVLCAANPGQLCTDTCTTDHRL
jgi:hypothetical protein